MAMPDPTWVAIGPTKSNYSGYHALVLHASPPQRHRSDHVRKLTAYRTSLGMGIPTSSDVLSVLSPRKLGCRSSPSPLISRYSISATNTGSTHHAVRATGAGGGSSSGLVSRRTLSSAARILRRVAAVKPVPTPPMHRSRPSGVCAARTRPPKVVALAPLPGAGKARYQNLPNGSGKFRGRAYGQGAAYHC